ncbi:IS110 family transposase [Spirosoma areae]
MQTTFVNIDIAKHAFQVAFRHTDGQWVQQQLANTPQGYAQLMALLPTRSHSVLEATGSYYLPRAQALYQQQCRLSVVNPLVIKRFGQMLLRRTKTDQADARLLSEFGQNQQPALWQPST